MMTTTHVLMAAALTTRPHMKGALITFGWLGGFVPDAPMFMMVAASRMGATETQNLWRQPDGLYWTWPWGTAIDYSHSIPIWGVLLLLGYLLWRRARDRWREIGLIVFVVAAGAFLHSFVDLLVHTNDAHAQFLPVSEWRFHSPVSYYQRDHYGLWVGLLEAAIGISIAVWIVTRFKPRPPRILAVVLALPYLANLWFLVRGLPHGPGV